MTNPRMGVSSHLEGVMNGTFLLAIGLAWEKIHLKSTLKRLTYYLLIYGTYANWVFVQLGAVFGTNAMSPIAGAGHQGLQWQETMTTIGLLSVGFTMVLGVGLVIFGFTSSAKSENA
ncbi:MAG: hypothetical protein V7722_08765, partial [Porticoccus sp.]